MRVSYLHHSEQELMIGWFSQLEAMFDSATPWLVGSVLARSDYRDVDVRVILPVETVVHLPLDLNLLNLCVSLWGQRVTGLPIDFQVQSDAQADQFDGPRHPLGAARRGVKTAKEAMT